MKQKGIQKGEGEGKGEKWEQEQQKQIMFDNATAKQYLVC